MASNVVDRTADFTFIWTIENCPVLLSPKSIDSPVFHFASLLNTRWHLEVKNVDQEYFVYFIHRNKDDGPLFITIFYELSFLDADGSPINSEMHQNQFANDNFFEFTLPSDEVFTSRRSEFLSNDTLSLRCRMWHVGKHKVLNNLCFGRTRLGFERKTIIWSVRGFTNLPQGREELYILPLDPIGTHFLSMKLCVGMVNNEEFVVVKFLQASEERFLHFNYEMSVLDITGKKHFTEKSRILLTESDILTHLFRKDKLVEDKERFLPNNVLRIRCEFEIGSGVLKTENEFYVRNSSSEGWRLV